MTTRLSYVISYVDDMDAAIRFYRDEAGFAVRMQSPEWSELETGPTVLALHKASPERPAGTVHIGFGVDDVAAFGKRLEKSGSGFTQPPRQRHGVTLAEFEGPGGAVVSVSGPA
jgi:catechol 2,3-dioxygenase-like lactoylglutathione lyase family enzyme